MKNFRLLAVLAGVVVLLVCMLALNRSISRSLKSSAEVAPVAPLQEEIPGEGGAAEEVSGVDARGSSGFQTITQGRAGIVATEKTWRNVAKDSLPSGESTAAGAADPGQARRLENINSRIQEYEKIVNESPNDKEAQATLQNLYMLKATLTTLKPPAGTP